MAKFAKGNAGGPGRPRRARELAYLKAMTKAVSLEDWREITDKAVKCAKNGDDRARNWLSKYLVGEEPLALAELIKDIDEMKQQIAASAAASQSSPYGHNGNGYSPGLGEAEGTAVASAASEPA